MMQAADVESFRAAWLPASKIEVTEQPDGAVQRALDRLATGVRARIVRGLSVEAALEPFQAAIGKGEFTSSPASLDATFLRDGDRLLIDVRMGFASSVAAFDANGKPLAVPSPYRWSFRDFGPLRRVGGLVMFDAESLQDAGVTFSFRMGFLRRTSQGYVAAGSADGMSSYDVDPRLIVKGDRVSVLSLDRPRSFFASNATPIMRRTEIWDAHGPMARRVAVRLGDLDVRAADGWLVSHVGTRLGKGFAVARDNGMANEIRRGKGWLVLDLEGAKLRFELAARSGKTIVRKVELL